jgi:hypothetical protein
VFVLADGHDGERKFAWRPDNVRSVADCVYPSVLLLFAASSKLP